MQGHRQKQTTLCALMPCENCMECPEYKIRAHSNIHQLQSRLSVAEAFSVNPENQFSRVFSHRQPTGCHFNERKSIETNLRMQFLLALIYRL